ncbi:MAG: rod shape-determining protein RodA, partial [Candidatus Omnitrophica bacterium]|nr:rod shape-determining protein RodA [Candidatus Omnitrophota bacterium]
VGFSGFFREAVFILPALGATLLGIYVLSGAEPEYFNRLFLWQKQGIFALLGLGIAFLVSRIPVPFLLSFAPLLYAANLGLVAWVLTSGTVKGGARSWFELGGFSYQPAETMKIVAILFLAYLLTRGLKGRVTFPRMMIAVIAAALPSLLIFLQPDLGSAMIFPPILLAVLFGARVPRRYVTLILSPLWAVLAIPNEPLLWVVWGAGIGLWLVLLHLKGERLSKLALFLVVQILLAGFMVKSDDLLWSKVLKPHHRDRLLGFVQTAEGSTRDLTGSDYHLHQSLIAISSGGMTGQGLGEGMQSSHGFIPMMRTDFIFAVIAEELGFAGAMVLFLFLAWLLMNVSKCAGFADTWGECVVVYGVLGMWTAHIFINIGMTMGLSPITGIPLPFVSYGGTSLVSNFVALGLVLSVYRRCRFHENPFT